MRGNITDCEQDVDELDDFDDQINYIFANTSEQILRNSGHQLRNFIVSCRFGGIRCRYVPWFPRGCCVHGFLQVFVINFAKLITKLVYTSQIWSLNTTKYKLQIENVQRLAKRFILWYPKEMKCKQRLTRLSIFPNRIQKRDSWSYSTIKIQAWSIRY